MPKWGAGTNPGSFGCAHWLTAAARFSMPAAEKSSAIPNWNLIYFLKLLSKLKVTWRLQKTSAAFVNIWITLHNYQQPHVGGKLQLSDTALQQNSNAEQEGKVMAQGAKRILGGKNAIIPTEIGAEHSFFGKSVQFLYLEAVIFPRCDSHTAFTTTSDSELLFFRPKTDPTIFSQFSSPDLFQSTTTSGSVWNLSLLSILSLAEH